MSHAIKEFEGKMKYNNTDTKVALLEQSIGHINETLLRFEKRFDNIDAQFDKLERKFDDKIDRLDEKLDKKVDDLETRMNSNINRVESKMDTNFKWLLTMMITLFVLNGFVPAIQKAVTHFFS